MVPSRLTSGETALVIEAICRDIVLNSSDGMLLLGGGAHIVFLNPAAAELLAGTVDGLTGAAFPYPVDLDSPEVVEPPGHHGDRFLELKFTPATLGDGDYVIVRMTDITRFKALRSALSATTRFTAEIIDHAGEGIFVCNERGEVLIWNQAMADLVGRRPGDALGEQLVDLLPVLDEPDLARSFRNALWGKSETLRDLRLHNRRSGEVHWVSMILSPRYYGDGNVDGVIGLARDMTNRKRSEDRLIYRAYHDQLTGLPNRLYFKDALKTAIANAAREDHRLAVLLLDLDNFKDVNDKDGHEAGDIVLRKSVERIRSNLRRGDSMARYGGDEFVILLPHIKAPADAAAVCDKIVRSLRQPVHAMGTAWRITASVGYTVFPEDATSSTGLISGADEAMYAAKKAGRNRHLRFGGRSREVAAS